jgi:uncharacterized protein YbjT (DUF2867 family)
MRILLAGASGVIGRQLVPLLVGEGHQVARDDPDTGKGSAIERTGCGAGRVRCVRPRRAAAGGVVIRYGQFYGPGTYYEGDPPARPRVSVAEAARRTVPLLEAPSGIVEIVDET